MKQRAPSLECTEVGLQCSFDDVFPVLLPHVFEFLRDISHLLHVLEVIIKCAHLQSQRLLHLI